MQTSEQREGLAELHARACMAPLRPTDRKLERRFCIRLAGKSSTDIGCSSMLLNGHVGL